MIRPEDTMTTRDVDVAEIVIADVPQEEKDRLCRGAMLDVIERSLARLEPGGSMSMNYTRRQLEVLAAALIASPPPSPEAKSGGDRLQALYEKVDRHLSAEKELATLRARLAEVERERDEARAENERNRQGFEFHAGRAEKERERALAEAKAQGYRTAMDEASERAREIARHYKPASDGWNTFLMMAEWCDERAALDGAKP
jgi:chromosome segregation ATPase